MKKQYLKSLAITIVAILAVMAFLFVIMFMHGWTKSDQDYYFLCVLSMLLSSPYCALIVYSIISPITASGRC